MADYLYRQAKVIKLLRYLFKRQAIKTYLITFISRYTPPFLLIYGTTEIFEYFKTKSRKPGGFTIDNLRQYDKNIDGKITREEFGGTNDMFDRIDINKDNTISSEDFVIIK